MGRSVPSWRIRVENELQNLAPYRRALNPTDREAFDALLNDVRERRTAGGLLPTLNTWQPAVLSMLVGLMSELLVAKSVTICIFPLCFIKGKCVSRLVFS